MATNSGGDSKNTLYCSFCGKSQHEVRKLIAGPTVFICDECVELCMDIIREENKASGLKVDRWRADAQRYLRGSGRLRDRSGDSQACLVGCCAQPLQAAQPRAKRRRHRTGQVQHSADWPDGLRQDTAGADLGAHSGRSLHDGRRDDADRSWLCR